MSPTPKRGRLVNPIAEELRLYGAAEKIVS
jgi:hypothetical protein